MVFVQSHHVQAPSRLPLEVCIRLAGAAGVPVIVDAAAEEDLRRYVAAGASLVIYSGGKALGGLSSSGLVAGSAPLIAAVRAQERGIGRAMKVGPEQLLSVCLAVDFYGTVEHDDAAVLAVLSDGIRGCAGAEFAIVDDEAGRPIRRLEVRTARATEVVRALRRGEPPIFVRAHHAAEGRFLVDPRNLSIEDARVVVEALRRALQA
jgi:D-glucosaminate-6-phosphate ammonia-lyase